MPKTRSLLFLIFCLTSLISFAQSTDSTLKQKIAQMLLVGFRGTELSKDNPIYADIQNRQIGGIILFDYDVPSKSRTRNIQSPTQLKSLISDLQAIAPVKLFIAIDQEGGRVNRLKTMYGFPRTVSAAYQGKTDNVDTTALYASQTAKTLADLGINLNFTPCVDVNANASCPVIGQLDRSFSSDPEKVVKHARIWIEELHKQHILACPKHFPGHGSSTNDTHAGGVDVTNTWSDKELIPYRELITKDALRWIMTSHVFNAHLDPKYPATLSKAILTELLREQMRFQGIIVSDDLAMGAITNQYSLEEAVEKAINAGVDILCLSNNGTVYDPHIASKTIEIIYRLVRSGQITEKRIDESYQRIEKAKIQL